MSELIGWLVVLFLVLTLVTLVGHGLWVLVAYRFGGREEGQPGTGRRTCPHCFAPFRWEQSKCELCGWPYPTEGRQQSRQVYNAICRLLYRFRDLGLLGEEQYDRLLKAVGANLLSEPPRRAAPAADKEEAPAEDVEEEAAAPPEAVVEATDVKDGPLPEVSTPSVVESPQPIRPEAEVAGRADQYAARRRAAANEAARAPLPPQPQSAPQQAWGRIISSFLEEKNIRWGELAGGLLIVCSSIALVISFWAEIAQRPLLKFGIFNGVSAALFAVGSYTDRRWKIHTTSHGVLIIATLLVPLNFLAIAAFTADSPPTDILSLTGEGVSIALFSALVYWAARTLTPQAPVAASAGVMLPAVMQLLVRRFMSVDATLLLAGMFAAAPLAVFSATTGTSLFRTAGRDEIDEPRAARHLILLGLSLFATLLCLGLLLFKSGDALQTLRRLAPLLVAIGMPVLATGLLLGQRVAVAGLQTASVSIGVMGATILAASVVLSWPLPIPLVVAAAVNAMAFIVLARTTGVQLANYVAAACLAVGWLVGGAALGGDVAWNGDDSQSLVAATVSADGGRALAPLAIVLAMIATAYRHRGWHDDVRAWAESSAAAVVASVALLVVFGFARLGDPAGATWYFAVYAAGATAAAAWLSHRTLSWAAASLLAAGVVQGVVFRWGAGYADVAAWAKALLAIATGGVVVSTMVDRLRREPAKVFHETFSLVTAGASVLAAVVLVGGWFWISYETLSVDLLWLALVWLVVAWQASDARWFTVSQAALAAAVGTAVAARVATYDWYQLAARPWFDPWFPQAIGVALAGYVLAWHGTRLAVGRWPLAEQRSDRLDQLLNPPWPAFDRLCELSVVVLAVLLAVYAAAPGTAQELSPVDANTGTVVPISEFELPFSSSPHAAGMGGWLLLAGAAATVVIGMWEHRPSVRLLGLLVLGTAACGLAAAGWADEQAVASASQWLLGGLAVIASALLWARERIGRWIASLGIHLEPLPDWLGSSLSQAARTVIVGTVLLHYLAIAVFVSAATVLAVGVPAELTTLIRRLGMLAFAALIAWLIITMTVGTRKNGQLARIGVLAHVLLLAGIAPLGVALAFVVASGLIERPIVGPDSTTWFAQVGNFVCYGGPLVLFTLALVGHAIRERSSSYAFCVGLLAGVVATLVYLFEISAAGRPLDAVAWIEVAQLNAAVLAVAALLWWGAIVWHRRQEHATAAGWPGLLVTQASLAVALCGPTFLAGCVGLFVDPVGLGWERQVASPLGLVATALAVLVLVLVTRDRRHVVGAHHLALVTTAVVAVLAMVAVQYDTGNWFAFRVLMIGAAVAGWVTAATPRRLQSVGWSACFALAATLVALRYRGFGPFGLGWAWLTITILLTVYGLTLRLAWMTGRRRYLWWSGATLSVAATVWWTQVWLPSAGPGNFAARLCEFISFHCLVLAVAAVASVAVEWGWARRGRGAETTSLGLHRFANWLAMAGLLFTAGIGLLADAAGASLEVTGWFIHAALAATAVALIASLWDANIRWPVAALYCFGLAAVGVFLDALNVRGPLFDWSFALALAAFTLASSYLWSRREQLARFAQRFGAADELVTRLDSTGWIATTNSLATIAVILLVFRIEIVNPHFTQRMTAAYAVLAGAVALALLAVGTVGSAMRSAALATGAVFAVAFGWAWVTPMIEAPALHRLVASVVALAAVIPVYAFGMVMVWREENEWTGAGQAAIPWLAGAAGALVLIALGVETSYFLDAGEVPIAWPALVAMVIALTGLTVAALAVALLPGRDPLGLSDRGRTVYVYAAEAILGLLSLHIRVTMPWLFRGWFLKYWPLVVMAIAFIGVGLSEWFRRRRQMVMAEPLENTGALLPLLPVVGYWVRPAAVDYELVLLSVGALYTAMSVLRKSPLFAALAALAVNGSLWVWLNSTEGLGLLEHPQLWLIPPLACVLVGAHITRDRLSNEQISSLRYLCAVMIYASSTADVFINGVGQAPWLPLVLAGLSICGIFAGIMMRVRAFLFLGLAFLMVSLFTVIWHAAVELDHTWVWWVSGIVTGVAIIALFGLFEKKRNEMLALVEQVKQWDA